MGSEYLSAGTLIRERYLVKSLIGSGNAGAVYLVEDQQVKRGKEKLFALKEITALSQRERYQFTLGSVQLRQIRHPALPRIYHVFNDDGRVCIVMDYVEGPDLETLWQQQPRQRLTWAEVMEIMAPIVDALGYLQRQEPPVGHGDVKPVNILSSERGFMLVDVGVARKDRSDVSEVCGYKAPELEGGKAADARADVYGLGASMYALLTGAAPTSARARLAHIEGGRVDPLQPANAVVATVPLHVSQAIQRAMSLDTEERFPAVDALWEAIATAREERNESVLPARVPAPIAVEEAAAPVAVQMPLSAPKSRRVPGALLKGRVVPVLLVVLLVLVGAGAGIWSLARSQRTGPAVTNSSGATWHKITTPGGTGPIATPSSSPGIYPSVVGSYSGTLLDVPARASAPMLLQGIRQEGAVLNGFLTVGAPIKISGPFSGTIDLSKRFQFTVKDTAVRPVLFVEGTIQSATSLSGDFYSCAPAASQGGKCARTQGGFGIWNVLLVATG